MTKRSAGGGRSPGAAAVFVAGAASPDRIPAGGAPEVALAGRSNVGKSSLLNRLVGRRSLARVSNTPGRTQQINFFAVGETLMLVDLPGYGFARVPLPLKEEWRRLVEAYLQDRDALCGVVVLVDGRRGVSEEDGDLIDYLAAQEVPCCVAVTKIDKLKRSERAEQLRAIEAALPAHHAIPCSAVTGEGVGALWDHIRRMAGGRARTAS